MHIRISNISCYSVFVCFQDRIQRPLQNISSITSLFTICFEGYIKWFDVQINQIWNIIGGSDLSGAEVASICLHITELNYRSYELKIIFSGKDHLTCNIYKVGSNSWNIYIARIQRELRKYKTGEKSSTMQQAINF